LAAGGKAVAALWHQRFFSVLSYAATFRAFNPAVMISSSRDGDLISPVAERLGLCPVRGSSSRGGKPALTEIVSAMSRNPMAAHVVDGPRGPKGIVKAGVVRLAQMAGAEIFPLHISAEKAWVLNSWDRFLIPKPFSKILIRWDQPIPVKRKMDALTFENFRQRLERTLVEGHAHDDLGWGWSHPL
jgi:lysophospholipid acyltransferase (LPLAT)-like uncharacterized protein